MKNNVLFKVLIFITMVYSFTCSDVLGADITKWHYDEATGLITGKEDAAGNIVSYTYEIGQRLKTRKWARLLDGNDFITTYTYDPNTGELLDINYSDSTPDIVFTYDRSGRNKTVTDALGTRTFVYNNQMQLESETISGFYNAEIKFNYATTDVKGRYIGFSIGSDYEVIYGYDSTGRINSASWNVGANNTNSVNYVYADNSNLIEGMTSSTGIKISYLYEPHRNLRTQVKNQYGSTVISQYDYLYDDLGRKTSVCNSGQAFGQSAFSKFQYNDRNELTGSDRYLGTNINDLSNPVISEHKTFVYDSIGNRKQSTGAGVTSNYTTNNLNQYTQRDTGSIKEIFKYDADGNLTSISRDTSETEFKWNGENRLIAVRPKEPSDGDKSLEYIYDHMGRRIKKSVYQMNSGQWSLETETVFIYDNLHLAQEIILKNGNQQQKRSYIWGLDVSGTLHSAGGIGGLLAVFDHFTSTLYFVFHDANGNVCQLINLKTGEVASHYRYDAFGNIILSYGDYADENPIRYSTKYFDIETGLVDFGLREYSPDLGRWISRDPIGEMGGINLYSFLKNNSINVWDYLGLSEVIISGGCNPNFHGWDLPGAKYGMEIPYRLLRRVGAPIAHDRNWRNFIVAAEQEIIKRKSQLRAGEHIEWHVDTSSYTRRAEEDGQGKSTYIDEIKKVAVRHGVILRWFLSKSEFSSNINTSPQGQARQGQELITRFTYFGHGVPGKLMLQYNNPAVSLTTRDIRNGILEKSAFAQNAIGISCGCNTATPMDNGESFRDVWKAYFGFEFYGVKGHTNYNQPDNVQPSEGAEWVPGAPPN